MSFFSNSGSIPPHFGELEDLTSLSLDDNFLTGSIPSELFADLDHVEALNLNGNAFNGTIPSEIGIAWRLQTLRVQDNQFSGSLPTEILGLHRLELLVRRLLHGSSRICDCAAAHAILTLKEFGKEQFHWPYPKVLGMADARS